MNQLILFVQRIINLRVPVEFSGGQSSKYTYTVQNYNMYNSVKSVIYIVYSYNQTESVEFIHNLTGFHLGVWDTRQ